MRVKRIALVLLIAAVAAGFFAVATAGPPTPDDALKLYKQGNWKEAYEAYSQLALSKNADPKRINEYLNYGINCLHNLGRTAEDDAFSEKVLAAHPDNWRLLWTAAQTYMNNTHYGAIIAGQFERGSHRGGRVRYVGSFERDRVRALQLMQQAMPLADEDDNKSEVARFYLDFAKMLLANRGYSEAWRLQYLTDLNKLPDYEETRYYRGYYPGRQTTGAPTDAEGNPIFYTLPKSWAAAENDGQRWRWCLMQAMEIDPSRKPSVQHHFADFLHNQFGVQTMAYYGRYFSRLDTGKNDTSGTYELHTLKENETIARLATGIKRFTLPEEFNYIRIYKELAANKNYSSVPTETLARIFENRRQYPRAAEYWKKAGNTERLDQIVGNWGMFETVMTQPAERGATVDFRFRNGKKVAFTAHRIKIDTLLEDVKAYLKSSPQPIDRGKLNIGNIGWRLVNNNEEKYIGDVVASWSLDLKPRPNHWDKRITVATPLRDAGAYLLTAKMDDGNICKIVLWIADTAIVKKPLEGKQFLFVADAVTGKPVAKANMEFFGYWQERVKNELVPDLFHYVVHTAQFAENTDENGQLILDGSNQKYNYSWLIVATTPTGRMAYMGFDRLWTGRRYDAEYDRRKTFVITDRPVYRPNQTMKFKFWVNQAQYDREGNSPYAGQKFTVQINNPKDEKVFAKEYTADAYGGLDGEFTLPDDATLGVYHIFLPHSPFGGSNFRVEEYKKPEFEVTVDAPDKPVMLGEKINAKITAKYYFGAPVTNAKVKYKVLRTDRDVVWYPPMPWDWFYGPGYWWYAPNYNWYPGWDQWGCRRPYADWWWRWHARPQPELVAEVETPIGPDGTVNVPIDTAVAKELYGDTDHEYEITAEVTDESRRMIVGKGSVIVAREPFKVYAWVDRGYYRVGDTVRAYFAARTADGKPVQGKATLKLQKITYKTDKETGRLTPAETTVRTWSLPTNAEGRSEQQLDASSAGQYRLNYTVTDAEGHKIKGGYLFTVRGEGFDGKDYRFNDLELITDKPQYAPGEKVQLMINTNRRNGTVLLFLRPTNGTYLVPKVLKLDGKSIVEAVAVTKKDMPNFFVEAVTVSNGQVHCEVREIVVPPESRILDVKVEPLGGKKPDEKDATDPNTPRYKPGEKAKVRISLTGPDGEPYSGSAVIVIYDKAVEYISGGSNVPDIRKFFWQWRRHHWPQGQSSLQRSGYNLTPPGQTPLRYLGVFGGSVADEPQLGYANGRGGAVAKSEIALEGRAMREAPPVPSVAFAAAEDTAADSDGGQPMVEPTVRTKFADTALWNAHLVTARNGRAEVELTMPENLTTWKANVWAMGGGARCGQASAEMITTKNLIVRLQAPRFFVQTDEVVISANVHNYLKDKKKIQVVLVVDELEGSRMAPVGPDGVITAIERLAPAGRESKTPGFELSKTITVDANGEQRVDWRIKALQPGAVRFTVKALTDEESDAMAMSFPVLVHGMLKTESFSGVVAPDKDTASFDIRVPKERRPADSRLEIRYSPTLAGAMVDALPYLVDYPYGCTEQTLNRFLPTVVTQKVLVNMGLDLADIRKKRTNLNAQEIGDDKQRATDWGYRGGYMSRATAAYKNPVFDPNDVQQMVRAGINRLTSMQCSDGGWGWFSGWGERSYPHTTAVVVHGLRIAQNNDVAVPASVFNRGVEWLKQYQAEQLQLLKNAKTKTIPYKTRADNLDALVYSVLVDEKADNKEMLAFLYRDRNGLSVYAKAMLALACHKVDDTEKRDILQRNVEQYLVTDDENQTAYLKLPNEGYWWYWYGSDNEAMAYYLKLLCAVDPKGQTASRLVKYLINNRKHATYWNSTRDTALIIEAMADYLRASGEETPEMTVAIFIDGKMQKEVKIDKSNLFSFDNKLVLVGPQVTTGEHKVEVKRTAGRGRVYFNAYLTNFTLEDPITAAGLEIKVRRRYYKLVREEKKIHAAGSHGQALEQNVESYKRVPLKTGDQLASGDLIEIELIVESKNDYEYIVFRDPKAAGCEPVELRSGYGDNDMGAYMELRDEAVTFFVRRLPRGTRSLRYRLRAEIPGRFSALPTTAEAMYAPELKANANEFKLGIRDAK